MRLKKLSIHNIASIEDAVIDFEAQPLAASEVFLITGKTGAGKSTILDSICLALYATTPRMSGTKMQGDTTDGEKTITISDPRQLMRRNTAEAYVDLTFAGNNNVEYEANWSIRRARNQVKGSLQSKKWELKNLKTGITLNKDNEIREELKRAIGLDFSQFCRTTMLAQGEFTHFLNSNDNDKSEILEKITGLDIYAKTGAQIYAITNQKKQAMTDAQKATEMTSTLTQEETEEKEKTIKELEAKAEALRAAINEDKKKREWIVTNDELTKKANEATEENRKATEAKESEEYKAKDALVREWKGSIDARTWMNNATKAKESIEEQKRRLDELANEYRELKSGQKHAEEETEKREREIEETKTSIAKEADKAPIYDKAQTIESWLRAIARGREEKEKNAKEAEKQNQRIENELKPAQEKADIEVKKAKEEERKEAEQIKEQEEKLAALDMGKLRQDRDKAKEMAMNIRTAKERTEALETAKEKREERRKELEKRQEEIEKKKRDLAEMEQKVNKAKTKMEIRKDDYEKQKETIDSFAITIREKLHKGDICPVCRQEIKEIIPNEESISKLISGIKEEYDKAEKEYREKEAAKNKAEAEIKSETESYERDSKAYDTDKSVAEAEQRAQEACDKCGIEKMGEDIKTAMDSLEKKTAKETESLEEKIKEGEQQEHRVKEMRKQQEETRKKAETLTEKAQKMQKDVEECEKEIAKAKALAEQKAKEVEEAEQKAASLISAGEWGTDWRKEPEEFAKKLAEAADRYNTLKKKEQELEAKQERAKTNNRDIEGIINNIAKEMPEWASAEVESGKETKDLLSKATETSNKVAATLAKLKAAEESQRENMEKLGTYMEVNEEMTEEKLREMDRYSSEEIESEEKRVREQDERAAEKKALKEKAEKELEDHQQKKPEKADEETAEAINERIEANEKQATETDEKKGGINQELKADREAKTRLGALIKEMEEKKAEYEKWQKLNELLGDATGSKFRKIAQSYVLSSLIHSANSYMKTLTDRYTLKVVPNSFVIMLEDAYQGYAMRAASTISGGESFLVSLSLALALSDIGNRLSVDTLFIDEGFGTLSGEPLQNAVNTLRSLHNNSGRHVGIISHVEELQERIAVQIQVKQSANSSVSKISIVP